MIRKLAGAITLVLALTFCGLAIADIKFPALNGRVVDNAHILSGAQQSDLDQKLAGLEQATSRQLVVVTVPSLQGYEIEDYGYQLGRAWGIGQKGQNNGVIFLTAPSEHKTRIEVGYGLEPVLTDALTSVILQSVVLPKFRSGDMPGGVEAGTDALIKQLSLPDDQAKQKVAQASAVRKPSHGSSIGGLIVLLALFFIFSSIFGGRRRGGGGLWWLLPFLFSGGGRGGGGGWSSGGGGGGFSGGGGSFGGGGSSGSW